LAFNSPGLRHRRARRRVVDQAELGDLGDRLGDRQERGAALRLVEVDRLADPAIEVREVARADARVGARGDHDGAEVEQRHDVARRDAEQAEIDARDLTVAREGRRPRLELVDGGRQRSLSELGLELLAGVREVAELLDDEAQGYVAAVDAAAEALRDPERTPSAALLAALRTEQASFFEYTLGLARSHAAYFRDFALDLEREKALAETARRSLEEAEALPGKDSRSFADYLRDYFSAA